jgi:hypothetical protein
MIHSPWYHIFASNTSTETMAYKEKLAEFAVYQASLCYVVLLPYLARHIARHISSTTSIN